MSTSIPQQPENFHLISHPLVQHKLTLMRKKESSTSSFRTLLNEVSMLMAYEVTHDMPMQDVEIETPLERMTAKVIDGKKPVSYTHLRAHETGRNLVCRLLLEKKKKKKKKKK